MSSSPLIIFLLIGFILGIVIIQYYGLRDLSKFFLWIVCIIVSFIIGYFAKEIFPLENFFGTLPNYVRQEITPTEQLTTTTQQQTTATEQQTTIASQETTTTQHEITIMPSEQVTDNQNVPIDQYEAISHAFDEYVHKYVDAFNIGKFYPVQDCLDGNMYNEIKNYVEGGKPADTTLVYLGHEILGWSNKDSTHYTIYVSENYYDEKPQGKSYYLTLNSYYDLAFQNDKWMLVYMDPSQDTIKSYFSPAPTPAPIP